jgi:asparagine synthase (glutamine-hydrolysing)
MCGIAGLIGPRAALADAAGLKALALKMAQAIRHRGPDRQGSWADADSGVALGHARLSILDLSELGDQPMLSSSGRYAISFNGEIYNFRALRAELEPKGYVFRGGSDTEVMLAALEEWGPEKALGRFDGMFAFALWDREERSLWLARDALGEKPLYYGVAGKTLVFGSELKALRAHPGFEAEIDRDSLSLYFRYACVPAPRSIYRGVRKLPPGCYLVLRPGQERWPEAQPYWRLARAIDQARAEPFRGSESDAVERLGALLEEAVVARMVSDVPLGAFLSGGVDSSLIAALMQKRSSRPVRTFTIGFEDRDYNESDQARAVAKHIGASHSESILTAAEGQRALEEMPRVYDEPFSDPSGLATYLVARHARQSVTVCLSGDAGDEFFAGYHRHFRGAGAWKGMRRVPLPFRRAAGEGLARLPPSAWKLLARLKPGTKPAIFADQMRKLADVMPASSHRDLYLRLLAHQRPPSELVLGAGAVDWSVGEFAGAGPSFGTSEVMEEFQYLDSIAYLPDDILTKVDRASMAVGLEARVPFLAPEAIAFAWSLPREMKARDGQGKWILRKLLEKYLPSELILRPKSGFRVPIGQWLRGPLRAWCESSLDEGTLRRQGYLDVARVRALWQGHLSGKQDREFVLWSLLMFQAWLAESGAGV